MRHLTFLFQSAVMTFELLDNHRDTLKEEGTITELRQKVKELSVAMEAATEKISRLQADLDHEVAVQSSRGKELELLRGESREREALQAQLSGVQGELEEKSLEL